MNFSFNKSLEIIENTPTVISALLNNLSDEWTTNNEGEHTWTVIEVVAHLIVCEETNWLPRIKIILSNDNDKSFVPVDQFVHVEIAKNSSLNDLIGDFKRLRVNGINELTALSLQESDFKKSAIHPKLGEVNLQQLIATWATHDLTHIAQISRIMAKQNKENVGEFLTFLTFLK